MREFNNDREKKFKFVLETNYRVYAFSINNANAAFDRYFKKRSKYPKFKSKKNNKQSFSTDRCKILDNYLFYIAGSNYYSKEYKNNRIIIKTSEDISFLKEKQIFMITISKHNNEYFVSFQYKEENNYQNNSIETIGVDLGIKIFATQSNNKIVVFPKQRILKYEKKINKLQLVLSKKQKDSKNYNKARTKLNKYYQKITNIKMDFLHKYTTYLAKNYKTIKIEDLNIESWKRKKRFSKSVQILGLGIFKPLLTYKTKYYDSNLIVIDRYYASSKICSVCGNKKKDLKLSDRVYICDCCNNKIDRDLNAAINISKWN